MCQWKYNSWPPRNENKQMCRLRVSWNPTFKHLFCLSKSAIFVLTRTALNFSPLFTIRKPLDSNGYIMHDTILGLPNAWEQMNIRDSSWREDCSGKRKKGILEIVELFADLVMYIQLVYVCKVMESYVITKVFLTACEWYVSLKSNFHVNMSINLLQLSWV